jgi:hypothetical protein
MKTAAAQTYGKRGKNEPQMESRNHQILYRDTASLTLKSYEQLQMDNTKNHKEQTILP